MTDQGKRRLRSQDWWDDYKEPDMTALYLERYLNYGLTRDELQSGRPIIGIAQTGSDLAPCNRHHLELASRVRDGIRDMGGIPLEFPVHPIQETGKRPDGDARPQPAISVAGRGALRLPARRRGADHRLRQDHAGPADGCGQRRHPGDRAVGRADAQRLLWRQARGLGHRRLARAPDAGQWRDRRRAVHGHDLRLGTQRRPLQHHGHGLVDEHHGRGAGHVAAPAVPPSPAPTASAARWPTPPAGARSRWSGRI